MSLSTHTHTNSEKKHKLIFENDLAVKFTQFTRFRHCVNFNQFPFHIVQNENDYVSAVIAIEIVAYR